MTTDLKTYSRTIDLRSRIDGDPVLCLIPYEVEHVDVDGKRKATANFGVLSADQRAAVEGAGFIATDARDMEGSAAMPEAKSLDEKAMLAHLSIKGWSGRAFDAKATDFVLTHHQAAEDMGRFSKRLVKKDALKRIKAAEAAARKAHKELTLPWDEKGFRILPAKAWTDYSKVVGDAKGEWQAAVDEFMANYDEVIEEARVALGGLFDVADYPTVEEMRDRFTFENEIKALDAKGDFRVKIGDAEIRKLQDQAVAAVQARLSHAMTDVYVRLHDVVAHMAERLRAYKPKSEDGGKVENPFRDATLTNVQDIVDLLPKLNLTDDPELSQMAEHVRQTLLAADANTLRSDETKRAEVAQAAEEIADAMSAMM